MARTRWSAGNPGVRRPARRRGRRRRGIVLVWFALLLIVVLGFAGLVIDGGLLLSAQRRAQNAADAAALAAAYDMYRGKSTAVTTAETFVHQRNGLPDATVTVNIPPSQGPYSGETRYVEVIVNNTVSTFLVHVLGVDAQNMATARAVAGYESVAAGEGVMVLDPTARPGLAVSGNGSIRVRGRVVVNSCGEGVDENGEPVDTNGDGDSNDGIAASGGKDGPDYGVFAEVIDVVGGVDKPELFKSISGGNSPLKCYGTEEPDPLIDLPTPTTGNGVDPTRRGNVTVTNTNVLGLNEDQGGQNFVAEGGEVIGSGLHVATVGEVILHPGVYGSLSITGGQVYLIPGIYVVAPQQNVSDALKMTGGYVTADGVMFYNTTRSYSPDTGMPDAGDYTDKTPLPQDEYNGGFTINSGMVFTPISKDINYGSLYVGAKSVSPVFNGMLFYQRRRNARALEIQGNAGEGQLQGTLYAKWALFKLAGQGTYDAQFIVGSMNCSGNGVVTILGAGEQRGRANAVFLVE